ncbi:MAG: Rrf2 family transcriptional regulator [Clostridia bacterium]|nr:Rrf2 family transcriptional regulator [Clostridia bacterium]
MISTKGRYSIRILLDIAEQGGNVFVPMKDVAERQGLSLKYVERIVPALKENGLVASVHGKGGGYRLTKEADRYTLWEILSVTEGDLAPVSCLKPGAAPCERAEECKTLTVWKNYYKLTKEYFSGITLADLLDAPLPDNYVI